MTTLTPAHIDALKIFTSIQLPAELIGFSLDSPRPESNLSDGSMVLQGWVLGRDSAAVAVRLLSPDGQVLRKIAVHQPRPDVAAVYPNIPAAPTCGFWESVDLLSLESYSELELEVLLQSGKTIAISLIQIKKAGANQESGSQSPHYHPLGTEQSAIRLSIAYQYIAGSGIEIGALHSPLPLPPAANVKYVDRGTVAELRAQYPELNDLPLVEVDIVADGEALATILDGSQDFVIANHFLEHCQNPILAIKNMLRVLKSGGMVYMAVPDKRYSFDAPRPVTPVEHLLKEYHEGTAWTVRDHYEEWVKYVHHAQEQSEIEKQVKHLMDMEYSIHFHVWTPEALQELMLALKTRLQFPFDIEMFLQNGNEMIFLLRKA